MTKLVKAKQENVPMRWKKPHVNTLKANWYALVNLKANVTEICVIILDSDGEVQVSLCSPLTPAQKPKVAETMDNGS